MLRVAFQGERGAYGDEAVVRYFGDECAPVPCRSFADVFQAVSSGQVDNALVPIENSIAGSINENYDLLRQHDLYLTGEINLPVNHCLMALPGQTLAEIKRVYSHPQALAQSEEYLSGLGAEIIAYYDTAGSAKMIREEQVAGAAAVASARAAQIYDLAILAERIQNVKDNFTRFVVLSRTPGVKGDGPHKTSLVMATGHRPGDLYRSLGTLAKRGINLLKIESRPSRTQPWEYVFYLDFEGHREDPPVREALSELGGLTLFIKVLGSFRQDTNGR